MTPSMIGVMGIIVFCVLLFTGLNVAMCMLVTGTLGCMLLLPNPMSAANVLTEGVYRTFMAYLTSVAPMFMLMGDIAAESGLGTDLFETIRRLSGGRKGVLASATQVVSTIFGAICGSGTATASMMSRVAYPEMKKFKYSDALSTGAIGSGASLSTLIPPSLPLITYGLISGASMGKLFVAGILTGVMLMFLFIITVQIWAKVSPNAAPPSSRATRAEKIEALKGGSLFQIIILFFFVMGGLFAGWFTPTEAGVVGVFGIILLTIIGRRFSFKMIVKALHNTLVMSVVIYLLIAGSEVFNKFFTLSRVSISLGKQVEGLDLSPLTIILILTIIYFLLGTAIEVMPIMLLTTPIFLPIVDSLGYDPIWFGIYMIVNMGLGAISPPSGISIFVTSAVCDVPMTTVFKGTVPFMIAFLVGIALMAIFPEIVSVLPNLMNL